ncbi:hypothetical protein OSTOST_25109, partial [Ostertagia ostertagi]
TSQYTSPFRFRSISRYNRLVRSTVYALKFIAHLAVKIKATLNTFDATHFSLTKDISTTEFTTAEIFLLKEHYRESEILLSRMPLQRFNAHRSTDGLIRCPHRMEHAFDTTSSTILLVPSHPLTTLIISHIHLSQFHSGVHATIATLRCSYFIPSIRSTVAKSIGHSLIPLQQFQTIICEIEAIVNSRPITSISDTISSPTVLRPIDFLSPRVQLQLELTETPHLDYTQQHLVEWYFSTLSVLDHFWNIWSTDYLNAVAQRHTVRIRQGRSTSREPQVGEVVLLADKQLPRGQWTLAVITQLSYTSDRVPRSATIRLPNGNHVKRSINHLYPLEISATQHPPDTTRSQPSRIQPTRAAKSSHRYIKPRQFDNSSQ